MYPCLSYDPTILARNSLKSKRIVFPRKNATECGSPTLGKLFQTDEKIFRYQAMVLLTFFWAERLLKVIELMLDGLKRKAVSTKRDLFYRSVKLFGNQARVDSVGGSFKSVAPLLILYLPLSSLKILRQHYKCAEANLMLLQLRKDSLADSSRFLERTVCSGKEEIRSVFLNSTVPILFLF